ncbi:ExbD/TolR family protein [Sedimentitalea todarodis]|uniref:Biopolymer transporter ExbD n=1 Tax=Sedimentitalea todarodis TaxID=1631240 RepID=A0ABU3VCV1_9RHOB|nr:biopolymer transporter ExbD [Sedimentitalea todarodis]MDU9003569.1 biopolymer transporter ExbD [Sedimentitalea todarodis]
MFDFAEDRPRRKPSLTPMIDVVFLLLVFFMLASRFGTDMHIPLNVAGFDSGKGYSGPPRLIDIEAESLLLNGIALSPDTLVERLEDLTEKPTDTIILRPRAGTDLQRVIRVMETLSGAGYSTLVLIE